MLVWQIRHFLIIVYIKNSLTESPFNMTKYHEDCFVRAISRWRQLFYCFHRCIFFLTDENESTVWNSSGRSSCCIICSFSKLIISVTVFLRGILSRKEKKTRLNLHTQLLTVSIRYRRYD